MCVVTERWKCHSHDKYDSSTTRGTKTNAKQWYEGVETYWAANDDGGGRQRVAMAPAKQMTMMNVEKADDVHRWWTLEIRFEWIRFGLDLWGKSGLLWRWQGDRANEGVDLLISISRLLIWMLRRSEPYLDPILEKKVTHPPSSKPMKSTLRSSRGFPWESEQTYTMLKRWSGEENNWFSC